MQERVRVFVIQRVKRIVAFGVGTHEYVMLVFTFLVHSRGMQVALDGPVLRKEQLHRSFVFRRENHDWLGGVHAHLGKSGVEHFANLLELIGDAAAFFVAGIRGHGEMRGADLHPA